MPAGTGQLLNSAWGLLPVEVGAALIRRLADPELPVSAANLGSRRRQFTVAEGLWWTELFGPHVAGLVAVAIGPETGPSGFEARGSVKMPPSWPPRGAALVVGADPSWGWPGALRGLQCRCLQSASAINTRDRSSTATASSWGFEARGSVKMPPSWPPRGAALVVGADPSWGWPGALRGL